MNFRLKKLTQHTFANINYVISVLDEIISTLITPELIAELAKPQDTYSHKSVRLIMEDVVHSSAMRLDNSSMDRLWELITMVQDLFHILTKKIIYFFYLHYTTSWSIDSCNSRILKASL